MIAEICLGLAGIAALAYWPAAGAPPSAPRSALKTAATALLAAAALLRGGPAALVAGLALGSLGDFALSRRGEGWFRAGLGAFLCGHLAYLALFLGRPESAPALLGRPAGLAGAAALLGFSAAMAGLLWRRAGALRGPVVAYVAVIALMGLAALTLPVPHPGQGAALLFVASDALLAAELFLLPAASAARAWTPRLVWPLYWAAQALFLWGFAFQNPA